MKLFTHGFRDSTKETETAYFVPGEFFFNSSPEWRTPQIIVPPPNQPGWRGTRAGMTLSFSTGPDFPSTTQILLVACPRRGQMSCQNQIWRGAQKSCWGSLWGSERDLAGFSGDLQGLQGRQSELSWCWQLCGTLSCRDGQVQIEFDVILSIVKLKMKSYRIVMTQRYFLTGLAWEAGMFMLWGTAWAPTSLARLQRFSRRRLDRRWQGLQVQGTMFVHRVQGGIAYPRS